MKYSIDRIEDKYAVCENENREKINIGLAELYDGAKEGDCFTEENGSYVFSAEETEKRKNENYILMNKLFKKKEK